MSVSDQDVRVRQHDPRRPHLAPLGRVRRWLESVPYSVLAIPLRLGVAWIFWNAGQVKLINWQRTIELFRDEYRVPLLSPAVAASMALSIEIAGPLLLVAGLFTRLAVAIMMAMTAVIQIFVYPDAWPTHLQWTAMMLVLLCRGAGVISLDHLLWRFREAMPHELRADAGRR